MGVTDQDLDDLNIGVRCILHSVPYKQRDVFYGHGEYRRATRKVEENQKFDVNRGYAPEYIAFPPGGERWKYKWSHRDKGVHHYYFDGNGDLNYGTTSGPSSYGSSTRRKRSTQRRGRPRKDVSAEDRARGVTDQDLDDLEFGVRVVLHYPSSLVRSPFDAPREISRFTFQVGPHRDFDPGTGYAPDYIVRPPNPGAVKPFSNWYKWTHRDKGVHHYDFIRGQPDPPRYYTPIVLRASTGRSYDAQKSMPYGYEPHYNDTLY